MKISRAVVAAAASRVSTKLDNSPPASTLDNPENAIITSRPQLSRRLRQQLVGAAEEAAVDFSADPANNDLQLASASSSSSAADASSAQCDSSFLQCIMSPVCRTCFQTMQENEVDWTNVVPDTPCQDVLGFLVSGGHCNEVRDGGTAEQDTFCAAFDACVVWDDEDDATPAGAGSGFAPASGEGGGEDGTASVEPADNQIDCSALTECAFNGMHEHFLGDGICHDAMPGCYNSKACNYDGGDCCEDTCHYPRSPTGDAFGSCGAEGYACRDPSSVKCEPVLARLSKEECANAGDAEMDAESLDDFFKKEELPNCGSTDQLYRLVQYDSWGDGWDTTVMSLFEHDKESSPVYQGGLEYGSQGTVHLCLAKKEAKCYHVKVENGVWGNEISWELRPLAAGAPALAAGGSPTDCTVAVGGSLADCPDTCSETRPDTRIDDPEYESFKNMEGCIEKKCLVQVGICAQDETCEQCMQESTPDYCYANDNFNVLIDCSMCGCTETRPAYCDAKASGADAAGASGSSAATHAGNAQALPATTAGSATGGSTVCSPEQTITGTSALIEFSECAAVDEMMAMVTDFDNDNFGMLDVFEDCAKKYEESPTDVTNSALDCMKILDGLIADEDEATDGGSRFVAKNAKGEALSEPLSRAISTLATHLYADAEEFCDCTSATNAMAPMCSSFINFKTLLYEAVDACRSLDAIDCAAWEEFHGPCKKNMIQMFETVDFDQPEQCAFVEKQCGGAGPFPAFRRLDCGGEIAKTAWDFHTMYERGCLGSSAGSTSSSSNVAPTPASPSTPAYIPPKMPATPASPTSTAATTKKQYKPYVPNGATDEKKPYHSAYESGEETDESDASAEKKKKKHHFFRNTFLLGALAACGFVLHKKRRENFDYARFRQLREARNYAGGSNTGGGTGEYTGVSMQDSCSFEPPTLPATPSNMI